jgi:hypothetical protein
VATTAIPASVFDVTAWDCPKQQCGTRMDVMIGKIACTQQYNLTLDLYSCTALDVSGSVKDFFKDEITFVKNFAAGFTIR